MNFKKLLPLLAIVCSLAACGLEEDGGALFKEPCAQWGLSFSDVKSYMKGSTCIDDGDENYLCYLDVKVRNLLPYTLMYEYDFETEYDYTGTPEIIGVKLCESSVFVMGTTKAQQETLNEEFLAFFKEKYNEVPLSSLPADYWTDEEEEGEELVGAFINDEGTVCISVGTAKDKNCIGAYYCYEF